ncbi:MAG: hypothetical protein IKM39_05300, partial [Clostridia bacterium]|nr:hypothetical protein [Clostridia bacterium]
EEKSFPCYENGEQRDGRRKQYDEIRGESSPCQMKCLLGKHEDADANEVSFGHEVFCFAKCLVKIEF